MQSTHKTNISSQIRSPTEDEMNMIKNAKQITSKAPKPQYPEKELMDDEYSHFYNDIISMLSNIYNKNMVSKAMGEYNKGRNNNIYDKGEWIFVCINDSSCYKLDNKETKSDFSYLEELKNKKGLSDKHGIYLRAWYETIPTGTRQYSLYHQQIGITKRIITPMTIGNTTQTIPTWTQFNGIVDTGCDITTIKSNYISQMATPRMPIIPSSILTANGPILSLIVTYDIFFCDKLLINQSISFANLPDDIDCLIGMNILSHGKMEYDYREGNGSFTFTWH